MCVCVVGRTFCYACSMWKGGGLEGKGISAARSPTPPASLAAAFQLRAPRAPLDGCLATGTLHHPGQSGPDATGVLSLTHKRRGGPNSPPPIQLIFVTALLPLPLPP